MTKVAQLHDGTEIHFSDETSDHDMDAAVRRHLGVAPSPQSDGLIKALMSAVSTHLAAQDNNQSHTSAVSVEDKERANQQHSTVVDTMRQGHLMARADNDHLAKSIGPLLVKLGVNSEILIKVLQGLTTVIAEIGKAHVEAIAAPKEIIRDEKGEAKGVQIRRTRTVGK